METIKVLCDQEKEMLLKFPAYISLLAANSDNKLDATEKKSAIKFVHIKTFSCNPLLTEFYREADQAFKNNITQLDIELPKGKISRETAIKAELVKIEKIVMKMGKDYALVMHNSMRTFKEHVSKAHHNVLVDFIFPMPIKGLTY